MPKRLAIVGCGGIAKAHAAAAQSLGLARCEIVALCDVDRQRANDMGREFASQALIFTEVEQLLSVSCPDAVIICTPPVTHEWLASRCLQSHVAVLCEKPLATEISLARHIVELAHHMGVVLRTTAKYRFTDGVLFAKDSLQRQMLGNIQRLEITFGGPTAMEERWNVDASLSGGGVLIDNGPHAIDIARFLLGNVQLIDGTLGYTEKYAVEDEASLRLVSATQIPVMIELSWRRNLGTTFLKFQGDKGILEVGWDSISWHPNNGPPQITEMAYDKSLAFKRQLESFLQIISSEPESKIPATVDGDWYSDDGLQAMEIITAVYSRVESLLTIDPPSYEVSVPYKSGRRE